MFGIESRILILILVGVWLLYFVIHSILASLAVKRWFAARWPTLMPAYRLGFNGLALILLIPPLYLIFSATGPYLWQWTGIGWWLVNGLALVAVFGFALSLRYYDGGEFLGLRQWRERERCVEDQENFHISPLHRYVRHPWYSLGLVLIWTRDMNQEFLATAVMATLYFILGSRLEERKLIAYHGDIYRRYMDRVPGLMPLPWRYLSREQADRLEHDSRNG
ncbi:methyltransferase family protein [Solemya velesiana gill symbiont]|uniref:Methanethiol S-methyltransferase n=1 Tax=Solemya velesiana gill symbiont TaxID=1918948 RepID=A0A1T2KXS3_9GAMM|nr:hypothetical protein [Solemya velesiana gill symbiont]OOZ37601.1 hypothetical protein BOW51_01510 [Solemya velesiana gill symbiont]